ncbi:hypothetical protein LIER_03818 [Lithospermum erythrorhizon]|uniref:Uncharacterized protein n=1 Tax=Lithospermum erythrorhizon TaxID=34254 RepID=A0AAV3NUJ0_LITER
MSTTSPSHNYSTRVLSMDPPLPPHPTTIVNPNPPTTTQLSYKDSTVSSPRSRQTDNCDEPLPQVPGVKFA